MPFPLKNTNTICGVSLFAALPLAIAAATAQAQNEGEQSEEVIEEVVTIGTRTKGRTAEDLPVPVDVLNSEAMSNTGHTEVGRMLQSLAPSFNFSSSTISDGTDALRPATLRGLGPDQTLVLINGKRRHQASLIHINTSVGRGTAGVDMNAIPASAIKRIEVLRDGAAAQYGSDAIAGVINIVLKDDNEAGHISTSYGEYSEGDGETINVDLSKGFELGDSGFVSATLNYRDREGTNRAGLQGACAYGGCSDTDGNGFAEVGDPREIDFDRTIFRIGDADSEQLAFVLNAAIEAGQGELYGFVTYSKRDNQSGAFYRNPSSGFSAALDDGDNVIPKGFLPLIDSEIDDLSVNAGYRTEFDSGMTLDLSYTYGRNEIDYTTSNSVNYSFVNFLNFGEGLSDEEIRSSIPRSADAYGLELGLETFNLDITHSIGDLGVAAGLEYRIDEYKVIPGEAYSYQDFDTDLENGGVSLFPQDAAGGIQAFNGIGPASTVDEDRDVTSAYVDFEYQFSDALLVSAAIRYDDYEDFGDTTNFKLAANWALSDSVRLRAAGSTGFRAPSMQQQYFNNIGTQFVSDPADPEGPQIPVQVGTFRNDSGLARELGIPQLKEEESVNLSLGVVFTPTDQLSITLDYYSIDIDDRIVISNRLDADDDPTGTLGDALAASGAGAAQFFLNGANTETRGFDLVATYQGIEIGDGLLDLTLAANKTETDVVDLFTSEGGDLSNLEPEVVFSSQDVSIIEEWQPEDRVSLTGHYSLENWRATLSFNRFGEYTVTDGGRQTHGAKTLTDLNVTYAFESGLSISVGGNNIFDEFPDKNEIGNSRGGALETAVGGEVIVNSPGIFTYSRRSAPFGFNGAYWYGKISYDF
ncbi:TonB-dependent receptor [Pseudomaricurvus alkylphenolicus]|jgi:iron complex outermembrane receptor protein|uniref:TonB-dependent receptor plug domain-containing protein n=1 Tax=Pseudomaricurvus alkylphenolicus TaxID=1306991 RepID=UPI00141E6007|nr:TonB-dependent receptor [Pseudomaricurvus alkylphenolicus]NIB43980.1 TonB-dependent receptor [Pseudomaricurvus alkylphenolicus]